MSIAGFEIPGYHVLLEAPDMQIRCASCAKMVEAPPGWGGAGFTCSNCGGDVTVARALASHRPAVVPDGLEVKQIPEGGFRIEYRWRNPILLVAYSLFGLGTFGHLLYSSVRRFTEGAGSEEHIWFLLAEALLFLFVLWLALRSMFGRHALEFDAGGVTRCFRLAMLPERRKHIRAHDLKGLRVTTFERAKPSDESPRWLEADVAGKRVILATGLSTPHLEWLKERISAVLESAGEETQL